MHRRSETTGFKQSQKKREISKKPSRYQIHVGKINRRRRSSGSSRARVKTLGTYHRFGTIGIEAICCKAEPENTKHGQLNFLDMFIQNKTDVAEPKRGNLVHRRKMEMQIRKPSGKTVTEIPPSPPPYQPQLPHRSQLKDFKRGVFRSSEFPPRCGRFLETRISKRKPGEESP